MSVCYFFFFFSSRRRHTRCSRDWSSDVCSSDLGPVDRKMIINALNSGASVFMADFEDANSPTWDNNVRGQRNLMDTADGTIALAGGGPDGKRSEERRVGKEGRSRWAPYH